jgi:uncharacterized RDD family membrane protein YckC
MADMAEEELEYVGFWARVGASLIDTVLFVMICWPVLTVIYGWQYWSSKTIIRGSADFLVNWLLPAIAVVLFWVYRQATPGKIAIDARIVDATTTTPARAGVLVCAPPRQEECAESGMLLVSSGDPGKGQTLRCSSHDH